MTNNYKKTTMKCYICDQKSAISQGCACNRSSHPKCIEAFNNASHRTMNLRITCSICAREFANSFINEIRKLRQIDNDETADAINSNDGSDSNGTHQLGFLQKHKKLIIKLCVTVVLFMVYIIVGCILIKKYYIDPTIIKNNQVLSSCTAVKIYYNYDGNNGTLTDMYSINTAYDDNNRDITELFYDYKCNKCPDTITTTCWIYKNYIAKNKKDVNRLFQKVTYIMWFATYWMCVPLIIAFVHITYSTFFK